LFTDVITTTVNSVGIVYEPCIRVHGRLHGRYTALYVGTGHVQAVYTAVYTAAYTGRVHMIDGGPCTRVHDRVDAVYRLCTVTAVYTARTRSRSGRVTYTCTRGRACMRHVYMAVYGGRPWPCTRPLRYMHGRELNSRVHGPCTGRVHGTARVHNHVNGR